MTVIRCVIVGIDHWHDLTGPFVEGLKEDNPSLDVVIIDNESAEEYPMGEKYDLYRVPRCGYGMALNIGAVGVEWDWLLCCNNDCVCDGDITKPISRLSNDTIYGNAWKYDYSGMARGLPAVADSAYFLVPRQIWEKIGAFDGAMEAAFEEIDYQIRALDMGFRVNIVDLPITHLNLHTRYETKGYKERWEKSEIAFLSKYPSRKNDQ